MPLIRLDFHPAPLPRATPRNRSPFSRNRDGDRGKAGFILPESPRFLPAESPDVHHCPDSRVSSGLPRACSYHSGQNSPFPIPPSAPHLFPGIASGISKPKITFIMVARTIYTLYTEAQQNADTHPSEECAMLEMTTEYKCQVCSWSDRAFYHSDREWLTCPICGHNVVVIRRAPESFRPPFHRPGEEELVSGFHELPTVHT